MPIYLPSNAPEKSEHCDYCLQTAQANLAVADGDQSYVFYACYDCRTSKKLRALQPRPFERLRRAYADRGLDH